MKFECRIVYNCVANSIASFERSQTWSTYQGVDACFNIVEFANSINVSVGNRQFHRNKFFLNTNGSEHILRYYFMPSVIWNNVYVSQTRKISTSRRVLNVASAEVNAKRGSTILSGTYLDLRSCASSTLVELAHMHTLRFTEWFQPLSNEL